MISIDEAREKTYGLTEEQYAMIIELHEKYNIKMTSAEINLITAIEWLSQSFPKYRMKIQRIRFNKSKDLYYEGTWKAGVESFVVITSTFSEAMSEVLTLALEFLLFDWELKKANKLERLQ